MEIEESRPPWAEEYEKRVRMIKAAKWKAHTKRDKFILELEAEPELLEQLTVGTFYVGDAMHIVVSNMDIKSAIFHYNKRVKEYALPKGQMPLNFIQDLDYRKGTGRSKMKSID